MKEKAYMDPQCTSNEEFTPEFFERASQAWRKNKKPLGAGMFAYRKKVVKEQERRNTVEAFLKSMSISTERDVNAFLDRFEQQMPRKKAICTWRNRRRYTGKIIPDEGQHSVHYRKEFDEMRTDECIFLFKGGHYDIVKRKSVSLIKRHSTLIRRLRDGGWQTHLKDMTDLIQEYKKYLSDS